MSDTVKTENSTEFQEHRNAVLNGITWNSVTCRDNPLCDETELHIGQVGNFQIYVSESPNLRKDGTPVRIYTMSLWQMNVHTKTVPMPAPVDETVILTRPGYTQLIADRIIKANDVESAKLEAVDAIVAWNANRARLFKEQCDAVDDVFKNLDRVLSDKVSRLKAADSIKTLRLSNQTVNVLAANDVLVVGQLTAMSVAQLKAIKGLGQKAIQEILFAMKSIGVIMAQQ